MIDNVIVMGKIGFVYFVLFFILMLNEFCFMVVINFVFLR